MLLILFDPTSKIFICSTDRSCICFKKLAVLTQFLFLGYFVIPKLHVCKFMNCCLKFVLVKSSEHFLDLCESRKYLRHLQINEISEFQMICEYHLCRLRVLKVQVHYLEVFRISQSLDWKLLLQLSPFVVDFVSKI